MRVGDSRPIAFLRRHSRTEVRAKSRPVRTRATRTRGPRRSCPATTTWPTARHDRRRRVAVRAGSAARVTARGACTPAVRVAPSTDPRRSTTSGPRCRPSETGDRTGGTRRVAARRRRRRRNSGIARRGRSPDSGGPRAGSSILASLYAPERQGTIGGATERGRPPERFSRDDAIRGA